MLSTVKKCVLTFAAIWSALIVSLTTTGCASGGYKLTRKYSGWVNRNNIVIRIVLYLLTGIVYAITLLIDMVIFNTMDFWNGRVSAGEYQFNKEGRTYYVKHSQDKDSKLRQSRIEIAENGKNLQVVQLKETTDGMVELVVDGVVRARVSDINSLPLLSLYDQAGRPTLRRTIPLEERLVSAR